MVIVIGAGPAGLATAYHLQQRGLAYSILEKGEIGSSWQHHYLRLRLNSLKDLSSLPGLPMPKEYPPYPSGSQFLSYLRTYARHFNLRVKCGIEVLSAVHERHGWCLQTNHDKIIADTLVMATGTWNTPFLPEFKDEDVFRGQILHARDYRSPDPFAERQVLIVGTGSSGIDIALDLAQHGVDVGVVVRRGINLVPRVSSASAVRLMTYLLSCRFTRMAVEPILLRLRPDFRSLGLPRHPSSLQDLSYRPVIGYEIVQAVRTGKVKVFPGIERFTERGVRFQDSRESPFDTVIMATGYRPTLRLIEREVDIDDYGYPVLNGCRSTRNPKLYCVGFSPSISMSGGWLGTIGRIAGAAVDQIIASSVSSSENKEMKKSTVRKHLAVATTPDGAAL